MAARAETGVPPLTERVRATPFVVVEDEGVGERAGPRDGVVIGSVDGLRPDGLPAGGFLVAADMLCDKAILGCESWVRNVVVGRQAGIQNLKLRALFLAIRYTLSY
jgi:hypothetical protein